MNAGLRCKDFKLIHHSPRKTYDGSLT